MLRVDFQINHTLQGQFWWGIDNQTSGVSASMQYFWWSHGKVSWQVRVTDELGGTSPWVAFGLYGPTSIAFEVDE